ncbi:uncharacterized protein LOC111796971 [Cucurbita pepo subsp. pepo]|nr:uncharacterized protein LOC111796971 [Cucurbita pepo subsp. pepo]
MKKEQKSGVLEMEKRIRKKLKNTNFIPWEEKKELIDKEEIQLHKDLDQLTNWIKMVDSMNDEKLKDYLQHRPNEFKILKIPRCNPRRNEQRSEDPKYWTSYGIMASVWKFHKQDNEQHQLS